MASLFNTKISDTYPGLIKTLDNAAISASLKELTDGSGNQSGLFINTAGDFKASGILEFGSLKDTGENITITKFVDEADGIANNDNDTTIPTSAAVVDYVASRITLEDLDFSGDTGTGSVDLDSQVFAITGTSNQIVTTASGQGISFAFPSAGIVLPDGSTATTQTDGDNSTKIATTAYVDTAIQGHDTLAEVLAGGNTSGTNDIIMLDGQKVNYGTNSDLQIFHSSGTSIIDNTIGDLIIKVSQDDGDIIFQSDNGAGAISTYFRVDGGVKQTIFEESIRINDNKNLNIGSSGADLRINHDGTDSFIQNFVGNLEIQNGANDKDIIFKSDNGSGGVATYIQIDGSTGKVELSHYGTKKIETTLAGATVSGDLTVTGSITGSGGSFLPLAGGTMTGATTNNDDVQVRFGTGNDLRIFHTGGNSYMENITGDWYLKSANALRINSTANESMMIATPNAGVELYYDNSKKFETTGGGVLVTGGVSATLESFFYGGLLVTDSQKIKVGTSADLEIYHDGSNSYISDQGTGELKLLASSVSIQSATGNEYIAYFAGTGGQTASLYAGNSKKFETTSSGVSVTGNMVASGDVYAEDNIYLTDTGTARAAISLDSSDRDNLNIKAISLGSLMRFYTQDTLALALDASQNASFSQSVTIAGDLTVNGTTTTVNTEHFNVEDPLISMAKDNAANSVDIGFYGRYNDGTNRYLGLFSDASDSNTFKLFKGVETEPTTTVDITATGYTLADLDMNNLSVEGTSALNGDITVGDTSSAFIGMARAGANYLAATNASGQLVFRTGGTTAALTLDNSQNASFTGDVLLGDNKILRLGSTSGGDFNLGYDGTNGFASNLKGDLYIQNFADDKDIIFRSDDGSGGITEYFRLDGNLGYTVVSKNILLDDNVKLRVGSSADLEIYHDGSHSYIQDTGTGDLVILSNQVSINNAANTENIAKFIENGAVELYYNNSKTFETTSGGANVTGTLQALATSTTAGYFETSTSIPNNQIVHVRDEIATTTTNSAGGIKISSSPGNDVFLLKRNDGATSYFALQNNSGTEHITVEMAGGNSTFAGEVQVRKTRSNTAGVVGLSIQPSDTTAEYGWRIDQTSNNLNLDYVNTPLNLVSYSTTGNATFAGIVETDKIFVAKGQNVSHTTSSIKISQENSAKSQIRFYGADASTPGSLQFMGTSSDGSTGQERMLITSAGAIEIKGAATTLNGNAFITNTNAVTTYGSTQSASVPKPMAWFTGAERLRLDANGAIYNVNTTAQSFWGSNNAGNPSNVTGTSNSSFGYGAGNALTTGYQNVSIGRDAGGALTTGLNNVNVGTNAGYSNVDGQQNTYIGTAAGYTSPGQNYNTFVGYESGHNNEANENTAVGRLSLHANTTGTANTAIGMQSLANNTTQNNLTAVGHRAGYFWTGGNENTFIGYNSGFGSAAGSTGGENTFIGSNTGAGTSGISGSGNTVLGRYSLYAVTSGSYNTAIGHQSGIALSTGGSNTMVGKNSGAAINSGSRNVFLGQSAGVQTTTASDNIGIGYEALYSNTTSGTGIVAIGVNSLHNYTGNRTIAIGYAAGKNLASDVDCVFIGQQAGELRTQGIDNTFVGSYANYGGTAGNPPTGEGNTGFGKAVGYSLTSGEKNTFVGRQAGYSTTSSDGNTFVGHNAGFAATGGLNTAVGRSAGDSISTGTKHTTLGWAAGDEITTGTNCTALGYAAGSGSSPRHMTTNSNEIVIGDNNIVGAYIRVAWTATSDARDKTEFKEIPKGLDFVSKLKPTSYKFRKDRDSEETQGRERYGFLAQEVLELEGDNPVIIDNTDKDKLAYTESNLVPVLVKAIQELKAEVDKLKQECKCK